MMEYIERNPLPLPQKYTECQTRKKSDAQGITSIEYCHNCKEFKRYEIVNMNELEKKLKRYRLRKILEVKSDEDFSILIWKKPQEERPREESYVLIKFKDEVAGTTTSNAAYEKGKFWYFYPQGGSGEINEKVILGWDYYPYNEEFSQEMTKEEIKELDEVLREILNQEAEE